MEPLPHRKRIRHFHEPGDLHELTFSCYQRLSLLDDDERRLLLCRSIEAACGRHEYRLVAFVLMPEHVHLLVLPTTTQSSIDAFLSCIKRPTSYRFKQRLLDSKSEWLQRLTVQERPGKTVFRFWQEGAGYDRNLRGEKPVLAAIDYLHLNPVRRKLAATASQWKWSSARWYQSDKRVVDPDLPKIHGLPPEFFSS